MTSRVRKPWGPAWGIVGFAALAAAVLAMARWQAAQPIAYARYVSPPSADGMRYTFLYPAGLGMARTRSFPMHRPSGRAYPYEYVVVMRTLGPLERLLWQTKFLRKMLHPDEFEMVLAQRSEGMKPLSPPPAGQTAVFGGARYVRSEKTDVSPTESDHRVTLTDPRSRVIYSFSHHYNGPSPRRPFVRDDAVIMGSFRLLSPGEAPPKP